MHMQMLTLTQASKLTGRHEDTIRRVIKHLLKTDEVAEEKITQEKTVRGFRYLIDQEYLLSKLQPLHQPSQSDNEGNNGTASDKPLHQPLNNVGNQPLYQSPQDGLQPLYAELKAKDETIEILKKQLDQKDDQIRQLLERGRETNILLKGYQEKYLLEAPRDQKDIEGKVVKPAESHSQKTKSKKAEQPKKKGFFSFLSRR